MSVTRSASRRVVTLPNALSMLRIAAIPLFVLLIVDHDTTFSGLIVFCAVCATDWVDGVVARATGQVSEVGAVLDPVADRLAIAAGLAALVARDAFPPWAALAIVVRDVGVLSVGIALLPRGIRIDVRRLGKVATFTVMIAIAAIAWGTLGYALADGMLALGWVAFVVGVVESYVVAWWYLRDVRGALERRADGGSC